MRGSRRSLRGGSVVAAVPVFILAVMALLVFNGVAFCAPISIESLIGSYPSGGSPGVPVEGTTPVSDSIKFCPDPPDCAGAGHPLLSTAAASDYPLWFGLRVDPRVFTDDTSKSNITSLDIPRKVRKVELHLYPYDTWDYRTELTDPPVTMKIDSPERPSQYTCGQTAYFSPWGSVSLCYYTFDITDFFRSSQAVGADRIDINVSAVAAGDDIRRNATSLVWETDFLAISAVSGTGKGIVTSSDAADHNWYNPNESYYWAYYNADEVTLTPTPDADSLFAGWSEKSGDVTYSDVVAAGGGFPSAVRWRFRKTPESSSRWTGTSSSTFPSDRSRILAAYFEKKSLAGLGDPRSNPHTVFRGGDVAGHCFAPSLPDYWVNTANLNLVIQATDFESSGLGPAVAVRRTYNAQSPYALTSYATPVGTLAHILSQGWTHSYDSFIDLTCAGAYVVNRGGTGKMLFFPYPGNLCTAAYPVQLTSPVGTSDRLTHHGTYLEYLEKETGLLYRYDVRAGVSQAWLTSIEDRNGQAIQIHYDGVGQVAKVADAAGRETAFTYDPTGLPNTIVTPDSRTVNAKDFGYLFFNPGLHTFNYGAVAPGNVKVKSLKSGDTLTSFEYTVVNGETRVSKVTDALGNVTTYEVVTESPRRVKVTDANGGVWLYDSNEDFQTTRIEDPTGAVTSIAYAGGLPVMVTYPDLMAVAMEYDSRGNLIKETDPEGGVTRYAYDGSDNLTAVTDALGGITRYSYDVAGNLVSAVTPGGSTMGVSYDAAGHPVLLSDPNGKTASLSYDALGNMTTVSGPGGNATNFTYDAAGLRMGSFRDPRHHTTGFSRDALGRVTRVGLPDGGTRSYLYDACALVSRSDGGGAATTLSRDALGNITGIRDAQGKGFSRIYDGNGNITSWTDPKGQTTTRTYDGANRLTGETNPRGEQIQFEYDSVGNLKAFVDEQGKRTTYGYDARGLLVSVTDPKGTASLTRDALGRLTGISDGSHAIGYGYDADGRLIEKRHNGATVGTYGYDHAGCLTSVADATGSKRYSRDDQGRVTGIAYPGSRSIAMTYDEAGNLSTLMYPDGTMVMYGYDQKNRMTSASWGDRNIALAYDGQDSVVSITRSNGTKSRYESDGSGRLQEVLHDRGGTELVRLSYTRDEAGAVVRERISRPQATTPPEEGDLVTSFDGADRIVKSGNDSYRYDAQGNVAEITDSRSAMTFTASYDPEGRPLTIIQDGVTSTYAYNGLGQRVTAVRGGATTDYHHDTAGQVLFETDSGGQIQALYIYAGRRLAAMRRQGQDYFYHFDRGGNTVALTDATGGVVAAYVYLPFGVITDRTGAVLNPFTYVGAYGVMEEGSGLYYMKARYYDARSRRFIQRDPIGLAGGRNPYAYVDNDPLNRIDPEGLENIAAGTIDISRTQPTYFDNVMYYTAKGAYEDLTAPVRESFKSPSDFTYYWGDKIVGTVPVVGDLWAVTKVGVIIGVVGVWNKEPELAKSLVTLELAKFGLGKTVGALGSDVQGTVSGLLADYAQDLFKPEEAVAGYFRPQKKQDPPFWMMKRGSGMAPRQKWFYERWFGW